MSQLFKLFFLLLISLNVNAEETKIDECYSQQGSDFVLECFNKKITNEQKKYESIRHDFVEQVMDQIEEKQAFQKEEDKVNKEWLRFIDHDCKMYALSAGERDGRAYNVGYSECILNKYRERENYFSEQ